MGDWLRMTSAPCCTRSSCDYNDAVDPADVERLPGRAPGDRAGGRRPLGDAVGHAQPGRRDRPDRARARRAVTIVDCVSSVGGMPFDADEWQLDICVAGPQKCLAGPPGISLMTVSRRGLGADRARTRRRRAASFMSMLDWKEQWLGRRQVPLHAVDRRRARRARRAARSSSRRVTRPPSARHAVAAEACRAGVRAMGLELWPRARRDHVDLRDGRRGAGRLHRRPGPRPLRRALRRHALGRLRAPATSSASDTWARPRAPCIRSWDSPPWAARLPIWA